MKYAPLCLLCCNCQIPKALGCKNNPLAYDITAACSGFLLGLVSAACHIRGNKFVHLAIKAVFVTYSKACTIKSSPVKISGGGFRNVLVIGGDALSRFTDWTDRGSCILFGDAAGAVLVQVMTVYVSLFYKVQSNSLLVD